MIPRVIGLAWTFRRPDKAEAVLDAAASTISDDAAALELAGIRSFLDAKLGRTIQAAKAAAGVLAHPRCSPAATHLASWGLAVACGGLGRLEGIEETLRRIDAQVESFEIVLYEAAVVVIFCLRGLILGGLLDQAEAIARRYRERCQDTPGPGDVITSAMCAQVAKSRGQVGTAARWYHQAIAALKGADPGGLSFGALVGLTSVFGMAGDATSAHQTFEEMTVAQHPASVYLEPDVRLAGAWVAAAEGGVSEAVTLAREAAEVAASQHQPAVEVVALHTAVCFGDRTVADRLTQLATQVDGPAPQLRPRTPPRWPPTTVRRCTPRRSNSNRSARCCWRLMPPPRPPPCTPAKAGVAPHRRPPPAPTGSPRPAKAPAPLRWPPSPHRCPSPTGNAKSSPSPPVGCPTVRSPNGWSSRCAPWKTTSTAPAPNSAPPIAPNSPPCSTATNTSCVPTPPPAE